MTDNGTYRTLELTYLDGTTTIPNTSAGNEIYFDLSLVEENLKLQATRAENGVITQIKSKAQIDNTAPDGITLKAFYINPSGVAGATRFN